MNKEYLTGNPKKTMKTTAENSTLNYMISKQGYKLKTMYVINYGRLLYCAEVVMMQRNHKSQLQQLNFRLSVWSEINENFL